jgi:hypothetical protein
MIHLKHETLSIEVEDTNPIYKVLSRFVGEIFMVQETVKKTEQPNPVPVKILPSTVEADVDTATYLSKLDTLFIDKKSPTYLILYSHISNFFGRQHRFAAVEDTIQSQLVTLVRVVDGNLIYVTVPQGLVSR